MGHIDTVHPAEDTHGGDGSGQLQWVKAAGPHTVQEECQQYVLKRDQKVKQHFENRVVQHLCLFLLGQRVPVPSEEQPNEGDHNKRKRPVPSNTPDHGP